MQVVHVEQCDSALAFAAEYCDVQQSGVTADGSI